MTTYVNVTANWFSVGVPVYKAMLMLQSIGRLSYGTLPGHGYVLRVRVYKHERTYRLTNARLLQKVAFVNQQLLKELYST